MIVHLSVYLQQATWEVEANLQSKYVSCAQMFVTHALTIAGCIQTLNIANAAQRYAANAPMFAGIWHKEI